VSAIVTGKGVAYRADDPRRAGPDDEECMEYDAKHDYLCGLKDGHDGDHWDGFDLMTWRWE
jgi:hypothetical protein